MSAEFRFPYSIFRKVVVNYKEENHILEGSL